MKYELGLDKPDPKRAIKSGLNIGLSYVVGGLVPLSPYFFVDKPVDALKYSALIRKIWAKRLNVAVGALLFTIGFACMCIFRCEYGECPVKQTGLYIMLVSSIIVFIGALMPDIKLSKEANP